MDINKLKSELSIIKDIWELAAEFHLELNDENAPDIFKVKIWKNSNGYYSPSPSHYLQVEGAYNEYRPTYTEHDNLEKAFEEVFYGLIGSGNNGNIYHANEHY